MKLPNWNPAATAFRRYVDLIAPWASNQWRREQFADPKVVEYRMDPSHVIFPIPTRPLPGFIEQLLLGNARARALNHLLSWVERFNHTNIRLECASQENRMEQVILLHAGVIGCEGSGGLYDAWVAANKAAPRA